MQHTSTTFPERKLAKSTPTNNNNTWSLYSTQLAPSRSSYVCKNWLQSEEKKDPFVSDCVSLSLSLSPTPTMLSQGYSMCWDLFAQGLVWLIDATLWTSETRSQLPCRPWGQLMAISCQESNDVTVVKSTQLVQSRVKSGSLYSVQLLTSWSCWIQLFHAFLSWSLRFFACVCVWAVFCPLFLVEGE